MWKSWNNEANRRWGNGSITGRFVRLEFVICSSSFVEMIKVEIVEMKKRMCNNWGGRILMCIELKWQRIISGKWFEVELDNLTCSSVLNVTAWHKKLQLDSSNSVTATWLEFIVARLKIDSLTCSFVWNVTTWPENWNLTENFATWFTKLQHDFRLF